ncbi:MAG: DUF6326 family protein [Deltaproteobacteria bacterium]|nr:DUF6326 family protein [Deltaproteobacteria bacterium]
MKIQQKISSLWIVVMFNIAFADIVSFIMPGALAALAALAAGAPGTPTITQPMLLGFALLLEVPIAMIFLSRWLSP